MRKKKNDLADRFLRDTPQREKLAADLDKINGVLLIIVLIISGLALLKFSLPFLLQWL